MKITLNWLKEYLPELNWSAQELSEKLTAIGHETEAASNEVLEVELTPNRGDCYSILGLARDLAGIYDLKLTLPSTLELPELSSSQFPLRILPEAQPAFTGDYLVKIEGYSSKDLPDELASLLALIGLQPKNLLIDLTNIVSHETGLPMHVFDFDKVSDGLVVDVSKDQEKVELLNGQTVTLKEGCLIQRNQTSEVVDLVGVMGGAKSAVTAETTTGLLQLAFCAPSKVRRNSLVTGITTDASARYQRGIDELGAKFALGRYLALLKSVAPELEITTVYIMSPEISPMTVEYSVDDINRLLGTDYSEADVKVLQRLGFILENNAATSPSWRHDISLSVDIAEEVARANLFKTLAVEELKAAPAAKNTQYRQRLSVAWNLYENGYTETTTSSFASTGKVKLANPQSSAEPYLRASLLNGLLQTVARNPYLRNGRYFEIGQTFNPESEEQLGILVTSVKEKNLATLQTALASAVSLPAKYQFTSVGQEELDRHGIKLPNVWFLEVPIAELSPTEQIERLEVTNSFSHVKAISKFPPVLRDVTLVVDDQTSPSDMLKRFYELPSVFLAEHIDSFRSEQIGEGKVAETFRLFFQDMSRSLTDNEVTDALQGHFNQMKKEVEFELR